ncbi:MAG: radical SAM protein [Candidatus Micrarchaeota archaeon]
MLQLRGSSLARNKVILGSPRHLSLFHEARGLSTLSFNIGPSCNENCEMCWMATASYPSFKPGDVMTASEIMRLFASLKKRGVKAVVIMSDGEPLFGANLETTVAAAKASGELGLYLILFTNGTLLDEKMIGLLHGLNPCVSFIVSMHGADRDSYVRMHGLSPSREALWTMVVDNSRAWREFNTRTKREETDAGGIKRKVYQFALHIVVTNDNLDQLERMKGKAREMDCFLLVTSPGMAGNAVLNRHAIAPSAEDFARLRALAAEESDNPGGQSADGGAGCCFITNPRQKHWGVVIHSIHGQVLPCPYYLGLGASGWFALKKYWAAGGDDARWVETAEAVSRAIVTHIQKEFGYDDCIQRHARLNDIVRFVRAFNTAMECRAQALDASSASYFDGVQRAVAEELLNASRVLAAVDGAGVDSPGASTQ